MIAERVEMLNEERPMTLEERLTRIEAMLVVLDRSAGDRSVPDGVTPLEGSTERIAQGLRELADAGADEAILVLSPITERSIRTMGEVLTLLDGR